MSDRCSCPSVGFHAFAYQLVRIVDAQPAEDLYFLVPLEPLVDLEELLDLAQVLLR